jgi:hypothetical protein
VVRKNPGLWWAQIPLCELPENFKTGPNIKRVRIIEVPDDDEEAPDGIIDRIKNIQTSEYASSEVRISAHDGACQIVIQINPITYHISYKYSGEMMEVAVIGPHSARWMRERVIDDCINGQHSVRQEGMQEFFKLEDV